MSPPVAEGRVDTTGTEADAVVVGFVAPPGASARLAEDLSTDMRELLEEHLPDTSWRIDVRTDPLVAPPVDDDELVDAVRARLLEEGWDLAILLTDLPLAVRGRPVVAKASPVHGVALLSVPALGAVGVRRRVRDASLQLLRMLLADPRLGEPAGPGGGRALRARARRLGLDRSDADADSELGAIRFTSRVLRGNLQLLVGMVRTNQPWRLAARLSRALTAAAAAGAFALVTSDIWRLANAFGWVRLLVVAVASIAATCLTLVVGADLWERSGHRRARQQTVLFNLATTFTVLLGVLWLYVAIFVLAILSAQVIVVPSVLTETLGHRADARHVAEVAWLATTIAMVGGALGAGLESDDAVRAAAYTYRETSPPV